MRNKVPFSISQALFSAVLLVFFFTVLNGYLQNLVAGYRANTWLVLVGVVIEMSIVLWFARANVTVERDLIELAGFLIVVSGVWIYFVLPSLPTLLPPTRSMDAVRVYLQVVFSYPEGKLVSWYPAGGAFLAAMFSHWLGWAPLRVLHLTAASVVALSAGAVYGMTCALLPPRRISKIAALIAPALLFVPWSYFAGIIDGEQYFYAQAFAQLFVLAALWYTAHYAARPSWVSAALLGAALLGTVAAYPIFVALPFACFALVVLAQVLRAKNRGALAALGIFLALLILAAAALQQGGILELKAGQISAAGDVGAGGVTNPSVDHLGGPIFLLLALIGVVLAWRANETGKTLLAFFLAWLFQLAALALLQPYLQISGYRVDKTFYILVFPLSILAALLPARAIERYFNRSSLSGRAAAAGWIGAVLVLGIGIAALRPPVFFAPFTESELQAALWAKQNLDTYQVSYLDPQPIRAYWLAFGLWRETIPDEWFQWIPPGTKLGPTNFDEWLRDPMWPRWALIGNLATPPAVSVAVPYQNGASAIVQKPAASPAAATPAHVSRWRFGSTIRLIGYDLPRADIAPGETITLTTYTESIYPPPATVGWRLELLARDGAVVGKVTGDPFADKYPVQRWPSGVPAREAWSLPIDASAPPGIYNLRMGLYRRADGGEIEAWLDEPTLVDRKPLAAVPLARIKIPLPPPTAEEVRAATPLQARVGDRFALLGYALQSDAATRAVHLTLYWQDLSKTDTDYTVFVHLLDPGGRIVAQSDAPPRGGAYPTSIWDPQEIVTDAYDLAIPADARGPFSIEIGMYSQPDLKRLPIGADDHLTLKNAIP